MGNSLQDELLKAGLIDQSRLQQAKKQKKKAPRRKKSASAPPVDPEIQRQRTEKAARDRALNEQREEVRRQREVNAQVRQLVGQHRLVRRESDDDIAFHFENKGKIKRIFVSPATHQLVADGKLIIVNDNGQFELVPPDIAEKIRQRNPSLVIDLPKPSQPDADDPYAAFQIPDDLIW